MNTFNLNLYSYLYEWDPFGIGLGNYDPEISDIIQAVHVTDHVEQLTEKIQQIFEFAFEKVPAREETKKVAKELLQMKLEDESCSLN
ncbi:DUF1871 family protein [Bacillus salitolerans]|uniref:DUF1871 family protein n=1 Tax=Bacillus salitolerans TaxID=1437434 RepID=A0ABW4LP53_9BACI